MGIFRFKVQVQVSKSNTINTKQSEIILGNVGKQII